MDLHVMDDAIDRYLRRYQLALRMMSHGARAQTVCAWTGLTRDQLVTLRRRWRFDPDSYRRGPAPTAFGVFFQSKRRQNEAALFASLYRIIGATKCGFSEQVRLLVPGLGPGELLCEALEAYREWQPDTDLDFEHALLLASTVTHGHAVCLAVCSNCHAVLLIDQLGVHAKTCDYCRPTRGTRRASFTSLRCDTDGAPRTALQSTELERTRVGVEAGSVDACRETLEEIR